MTRFTFNVIFFIHLVDEEIFKHSVWIGGSDQQVEGVFVWSDKGNNFTLTNWQNNQPDNNGEKEHCVEMIAFNGKWNDRPCSAKIPFVCEKDIQ